MAQNKKTKTPSITQKNPTHLRFRERRKRRKNESERKKDGVRSLVAKKK